MPRYVAFLGGLNVGKAHRVSMANLQREFDALGFDDASTYINSGNVVFSGPEPSEAAVERHLEATFGFAVPTFVRTASAVQKLATKL